jgi:alpha-beta hydrolase superfamily lysophospholipase
LIFIGGHSLGGLIAALIGADNPSGIKGVFISGAAFRLGFDPPGWKVTLGKIMSGLLPGLTMGNELDVNDLTHNLEIVELQRNDPHNHGKISTRAFVEFIKTQNEVLEKAKNLKMPILIMHGDQDRLAALPGSKDFYEAVGSKEKQFKIYEGFFHEIFNELDRDRVINDLIGWLEECVRQEGQNN